MNTSAKELLLDLLKLKVRYSESEFESVAKVLHAGSDEFLVNIISNLRDLDMLSERKPKLRSQKKTELEHWSEKISDDPEKQELLRQLGQIIQAKEAFRTVKDLQMYVAKKVVLTASKNTKAELVNKYMSTLSGARADEIAAEIQILSDRINSEEEVSGFLNMANAIVHARIEPR